MFKVVRLKHFLYALMAAAVLYACKHDPKVQGDDIKDPVPYTLQYPSYVPAPDLPADNPLTVEGVSLGRYLFYDPILSLDNSVACASCHIQEFAFSDTAKYSAGVNGTLGLRNSMPLFNLAWNPHFFWDGRAAPLRAQIHFPITDGREMKETIPNVVNKLNNNEMYRKMFKKAFKSDVITDSLMFKALEQFLLSIVSWNSKYDKWMRGEVSLDPLEEIGLKRIFEKEINLQYIDTLSMPSPLGTNGFVSTADCFHCHGNQNNPFFSNNFQFETNGLDASPADSGRSHVTGNPNDFSKFKIPTLRNIGFTYPYMHDGRFKTLMEVVNHYDKPNKNAPNLNPTSIQLSADNGLRLRYYEKNALIKFLIALNDTSFIHNPAYSNPFK